MFPLDDQPKEIDGRFRLEGGRIAGGMGMVYRGVDLSTSETVAVKISTSFGSQLGERFQQEANCLATMASTTWSWSGLTAKPSKTGSPADPSIWEHRYR